MVNSGEFPLLKSYNECELSQSELLFWLQFRHSSFSIFWHHYVVHWHIMFANCCASYLNAQFQAQQPMSIQLPQTVLREHNNIKVMHGLRVQLASPEP